ncbi:methyltransferase [Bosea sp. WAO]|uniref:class I SAM-dependent methyltransferase n=1 Tax=Bosea sp. WAO TaxID=406341 RepID=UPI0007462D44|nr:class I SAM-dependent methyltransferase [Bosea sp. WAO]KUL96965.1 methyltransferase [Bosea sp. WAO]
MPVSAQDNASQYGDSRKLAARARLHTQYMVAEQAWFPWVGERLPLATGQRVLDIGCGPGWFWAAVAESLPRGLDLTLVDFSPGIVAEAQERCRAGPFAVLRAEQADAIALPFADGSFDTVVAMHMLYHLPDPARGIAEMHRVLKPDGHLAVTTNGIGNMRDFYQLATTLGSAPADPSALAFGYDTAERLMSARFGDVTMAQHPARLRITDPEDVFLALTSYPPGDIAGEAKLASLRHAIAEAFWRGGGVLDAEKQTGLFLSRKLA